MEEKKVKRSFNKARSDEFGEKRGLGKSRKPVSTGRKENRSFRKDRIEDESPRSFLRRERKTDDFAKKRSFAKPFKKDDVRKKRRDVTAESEILTEIVERRHREGRPSPRKPKVLSLDEFEQHSAIRLNKYIANAGICSRREADTLIESGAIMVNGEIVSELGTKVMPTDEVRFGDRILQREKPVYVLLNKPKDYITTMEDDRGRKNVLDLVRGACKERIYPVGRLDKNTTGLLLFTNDGEMTKRLTHPKHGVRKTYHVELNKKISSADFQAIADGLELEDGVISVDEIAYVGDTKREVGVTIHSGRNRIVRRIFESLGYEVVKLDRVIFAGLTKKDLKRGHWRFLTEAEVNILKMTTKKL